MYFDECADSSSLCNSIKFGFSGEFLPSPANGCTPTVTSGSCSFYSACSATGPTAVSAGTLTIAGGNLGAGVAVTPDSSNVYNYTSSSAMFSAAQTLTVSASGGTVPAFGAQSVVAPSMIVITAPAASGGSYTIPTSTDLTVEWTGGQAGAQVLFEGTLTGTPQTYFTCIWDGGLGRATVPHAVLAGLAGQSGALLAYGQMTTASFAAGSYSVTEGAFLFGGANASFQ